MAAAVLMAFSLINSPASSAGQSIATQGGTLLINSFDGASVVEGEMDGRRLSEWLLKQTSIPEGGSGADFHEEGLIYGAQRLVDAQRMLKNSLLTEMFDRVGSEHPLYRLLEALPVTGRLQLPHQDPRLLQARPRTDPVIASGDRIAVARRSNHIVVLDNQGTPCSVAFEARREAAEYVRRCKPGAAGAKYAVWLIQPDGQIHSIPLGAWAQSQQVLPKPGAWVWIDDQVALTTAQGRWLLDWVSALLPGDAKGNRLSENFGARMAQFLSTQGPAVVADASAAGEGSQLAATSTALAIPDVRTLSEPDWVNGSPFMHRSRDLPVSSGDFGTVGLLQTPTARMKPAGAFTYTNTVVKPYRFYNLIVQPFDWMEAGFRYTKINNREYGPGTEERYTDKGIDVKFRLIKESAWVPEVAVGVRDVGGTGLFSGEYVVASKRYGDFDFSAGLGWGYFGRRGDIRNPLSRISEEFNTRTGFANSFSSTGQLSTNAYFRGPTALFGGVQYHTPFDPLTLKVEYDGNNYQTEPLGNVFPQDSRWNFGAVYKISDLLDIRIGRERGNTTMIGFSLSADLLGPATMKILDKPAEPVLPKRDNKPADWEQAAKDIRDRTEWEVREIRRNGHELTATIDNGRGFYYAPKVEAAAAILNREAPTDIDWLNVEFSDRMLGLARQSVDRQAFVKENTEFVPAAEKTPIATSRPTRDSSNSDETLFQTKRTVSRFTVAPTFQQTLGGPSGFLFYQIGVGANAVFNLTDKTWWNVSTRYRLLDNYDNYEAAGKLGTLPEVRSLLKDYQTASRFNIPNLQLTHVEKVGDRHYFSAYGGLLEWMFGGVGAEYLYRPFGSPLAIGVDVNRVRQRSFEQRFDFRDYQVNTGHVTAYWDTGFEDILARFSVGQYLAGDRGFTLDLSRAFRNGVVMGGFFSRTNVTPEQFGEGSFDKGLYIGIPFDVMLPKSSSGMAVAGWKPLTRDGGAMLQRSQQLFTLTDKAGTRALFNQAVQGTYLGR